VIRIINERIAGMEDLLAAFVPSGGGPTGVTAGESPVESPVGGEGDR